MLLLNRPQLVITAILSLTVSSTLVTVHAEAIDTDWLYLSETGSWLYRSQAIEDKSSSIPLPVASLSASQFWWQAAQPGAQLSWSSLAQNDLPRIGSKVTLEGDGEWLVKEIDSMSMILQRDDSRRYLPQDQWYRLTWNADARSNAFELNVTQVKTQQNKISYAWQDPNISAQVRYRLSLNEQSPTLYQELIVSNLTDYEISAPGYSFAQTQQRPMFAMREMALADSVIAQPTAGQSQGIPTLVASSEVHLAAGSYVWLPVASVALKSAQRSYQIQWNTQQQGEIVANTSLVLTSKTALPNIAGQVSVGVFDGQVALIESRYQPASNTEATLALGQNSLVNAQATQIEKNKWQLTVMNRTKQEAKVELSVSHWDGKIQQQLPLALNIKADGMQEIYLELDKEGQLRVSSK